MINTTALVGQQMPHPALFESPDYFRACTLCLSHCEHNGQRSCKHPTALLAGGPQPITLMRKPQQSCGPDAYLMSTPWLP